MVDRPRCDAHRHRLSARSAGRHRGWGKTTLTDTDAFVATYAPLAHDPVVQSYIVDQASTAINANLDVEQLTSDVIDGSRHLASGHERAPRWTR